MNGQTVETQDDEVLVDQVDHTLVVTLNRPEQRNAMTRRAGELIAGAMDRLDADDQLRVGIVTGGPRHFCAGLDLKRFAAGETAGVPGRGFGGLTQRPPRKPLIAAVEGAALAGGFEMVLASDIVIAARNSRFGLPEVRRGLVARAGGLLRLPSRLPRSVAMGLILTGEPIDAEQAHRYGLITELADSGAVLELALAWAKRIADSAPLAVEASKRIVMESPTWPPTEQFERQAMIADPVFASADAAEGARSFLEKRAPEWTRT